MVSARAGAASQTTARVTIRTRNIREQRIAATISVFIEVISGLVCISYTGLADSAIMPPMKYWKVVADKLSAAGWSLQ
jgi:hypothetical protein